MSTTPLNLDALAVKHGGTLPPVATDLDALAAKHGGTISGGAPPTPTATAPPGAATTPPRAGGIDTTHPQWELDMVRGMGFDPDKLQAAEGQGVSAAWRELGRQAWGMVKGTGKELAARPLGRDGNRRNGQQPPEPEDAWRVHRGVKHRWGWLRC